MAIHRDLVDLARAAARRAAAYVRSAPRPAADRWDRKDAADFVTHVDRESERLIRETLLHGTPHAVVMGEELAPDAVPDAGLVWIVDPLDGTTNYLHRYPAYAVSIGARLDGELVAGVVLDIDRDVCCAAAPGEGATCVGPPGTDVTLRVSDIREPTEALIGTGFPFKRPATEKLDPWMAQFRHLLGHSAGIRRAGSAALDLADVARGRFDGFWEYGLAPWDMAAGTVLVREAGGRVTDLAGRDVHTPPPVDAGPLVAGNPAIHAWLLDTLRSVGA